MEEASADIQHAIELDPLYVLMHGVYAFMQVILGRPCSSLAKMSFFSFPQRVPQYLPMFQLWLKEFSTIRRIRWSSGFLLSSQSPENSISPQGPLLRFREISVPAAIAMTANTIPTPHSLNTNLPMPNNEA